MRMVKKFIDGYCQLLGYFIAAALALMVVLVFGNVFMRYALNSGFTVSEELSRWLFVWVTFMGAVIALRDNAHLGTDMLVGKLGPAGKRICMGLSLMLMLSCLWLIFKVPGQQGLGKPRDGGVYGLVLCLRHGVFGSESAYSAGGFVPIGHGPD
jgi:TRAP-type C4-dicarboxylate transport system permease small subunit